jgi:hypothetical protein
MVFLLALTGMGCQNRVDGVPIVPTPPTAVVTPAVDALPGSNAPPPYPRYFPETGLWAEAGYPTAGDAMRATFCSFFLGHDPEVPSVREIEESVYGYGLPR